MLTCFLYAGHFNLPDWLGHLGLVLADMDPNANSYVAASSAQEHAITKKMVVKNNYYGYIELAVWVNCERRGWHEVLALTQENAHDRNEID